MKNGFCQMARSEAIMACFAVALALVHNGALGEEISPDSLKLRAGVVKAEGYETPPAKGYIVANSTNVFSGHALYGTDVTGQLKLGEKVGGPRQGEGLGLDACRKGRHRHRLRANFDARS